MQIIEPSVVTLEQPELLLDFDDTEVGGGGRF